MQKFLKREIFRLLTVALFLPLWFFFLFNAQSASNQTIPNDFSIEFTSSPALISKPIDVETVTISADGTTVLSPKAVSKGDFPNLVRSELPEETLVLDPGSLQKILEAIETNNFFALKETYIDPDIMDGDWARLTITLNGQTHTVTTRNIKVKAFDTITITINAQLPEDRRLKYNAINGADYKEVER